MLDYVKPIQRDLEPETNKIYIDTSDLRTDKIPD